MQFRKPMFEITKYRLQRIYFFLPLSCRDEKKGNNQEKINAKFVSFQHSYIKKKKKKKGNAVSHLACHSCNFLQRFETCLFRKNEEAEGEEGRKRTNRGVLRKLILQREKCALYILHLAGNPDLSRRGKQRRRRSTR